MSSEDQATQELLDLEEEALKVADQVQTYQRKLMAPVYAKRREIAKQIPNFWSQVVKKKNKLCLHSIYQVLSFFLLVAR